MKRIIKTRKLTKRPYADCFVCIKPNSPNQVIIQGYWGILTNDKWWLCDKHLAEFKEQVKGL
jgi:hypothetical protein